MPLNSQKLELIKRYNRQQIKTFFLLTKTIMALVTTINNSLRVKKQ